jgi:hypothetical protein
MTMQHHQDEIEALRAKCALLSASLAQAESEQRKVLPTLDTMPPHPTILHGAKAHDLQEVATGLLTLTTLIQATMIEDFSAEDGEKANPATVGGLVSAMVALSSFACHLTGSMGFEPPCAMDVNFLNHRYGRAQAA